MKQEAPRRQFSPRGTSVISAGSTSKRQTNISLSLLHLVDSHHVEEPAHKHRRISAHSGPGYPRGGGVGLFDPASCMVLVVELLQDHHLVPVVECPEEPGFSNARSLESGEGARILAVNAATSSTDAMAATTTPGAVGSDGVTLRTAR